MDTMFSAQNHTSSLHSSSPLHILSGSFRSLSLFLLAFSPIHRNLSHVQTIDAFGPHQYIGVNQRKDRAYTTSWALPPALSSWEIVRGEHSDGEWKVNHINNAPITATSSYVTIPPPYTHIYSAGGPTGEAHVIDSSTGGFGEKVQQVLFVGEDELGKADKTRVALRTGSHAVEFSPSGHAFIPVLATDSIEVYTHNPTSGQLSHIFSSPSPRRSSTQDTHDGPHDGPRHLKIHPNGKILYCVTEHNNLLDVYRILPDSTTPLQHVQEVSLLPPNLRSKEYENKFRGDTLLLTPSTPANPAPRTLFASTRGAKSSSQEGGGERGWLSVIRLDDEGLFLPTTGDEGGEEVTVERWQTPTSGGKANALDVRSKSLPPSSSLESSTPSFDDPSIPDSQAPVDAGADSRISAEVDEDGEAVWILLTDDDDLAAGEGTSPSTLPTGGVRVLEWNGWGTGGVKEVAAWPSSHSPQTGEAGREEDGKGKEKMRGGSHAVWLD